MINPYPDIHGVALDEDADIQAGMHRGYEEARQDAIKAVEGVKSINIHKSGYGEDDAARSVGYNLACDDIIAALKSEE